MRLKAIALLAFVGSAAAAQDAGVAAVKHALKRGDTKEAVALGEHAAAESPGSSEAHHLLGKAYGMRAKEAALFAQGSLAKKCRAELARAVELDPSNVAAALDLVRYDARAPAFLGGGREKAAALAEEIGKRRRSRGEVARGIVYEAEKNLAAAEGAYRGALMADASDGEALSSLSDFLASRKRWDDAFTACRSAAERAPEDPRPQFEIGLLSAKSARELERGLAALERFLALPPASEGPDFADGHELRGRLLMMSGELEAARAELEQALALEPRHAAAVRSLAELARKGARRGGAVR